MIIDTHKMENCKVNILVILICVIFGINRSCYAQDAFSEESSAVILVGASIIDVEKMSVRKGRVFIKGDKIDQIDYSGQLSIPPGAVEYDLTDHFLIPGLIDAHVHLCTDPSGSDNIESTKQRLKYLLNHGITGVRDMAGDARVLTFLARQALLNEIASPEIYYSALMAGSIFFDDPRTHASSKGIEAGQIAWMMAVDENTNMSRAISAAKGSGASGIKIYADLDKEVIQMITDEAHHQDLQVWAHATVFPAKPQELIDANVDVLSHASLLAWEGVDGGNISSKERYSGLKDVQVQEPVLQRVMSSMVSKDAILDATLAVYKQEGGDHHIYKLGKAITILAYEHGVKIGVGTDNLNLSDMPRELPLITEMNLLVDDVGMSPMEVIRAATLVNAEMVGMENVIGSISAGKVANIVVLKQNPLVDINKLSSIRYVIKNGRVYIP